MSDKKPAHKVVLEMIEEGIEGLCDKDSGEYEIARLCGKLNAEVEMLKRMIIPEQHREEVVISLQKIKEKIYPSKAAELLLPDSVLLAINPPAEKVKK